jgi:sugar phosphate isomerase/epimerase
MRRVLSTYLFVQHPLTAALLEELERAGVPAVEIFCLRNHFDYRAPDVVRKTADWFAHHGMKLHSLHAPTSREFRAGREGAAPISISDLERVRRLDAVDEVKRTLDVAESLPFRYLVLHMGAGREAADPRRYDAAFSSLEHLTVFAKQRGVTIAVENTPGELATPSNLRHFIQDTRLAELRMCFDAGHAHMEDGVVPGFEAMREWVVTAHIHDNSGEKDEHLLPFEGTIDWKKAAEVMRDAPAALDGLPLVLELREQPGAAPPTGALDVVWGRLEKAIGGE